jgi:hypothetical protein
MSTSLRNEEGRGRGSGIRYADSYDRRFPAKIKIESISQKNIKNIRGKLVTF